MFECSFGSLTSLSLTYGELMDPSSLAVTAAATFRELELKDMEICDSWLCKIATFFTRLHMLKLEECYLENPMSGALQAACTVR